MREAREGNRARLAAGRHVGVALAVASLLGLFLIQPFHAPAPIGADARVFTAVGAAGSELPAQQAPHDADGCPVCRATTQTRWGLRALAHADPAATQPPLVALHLPALSPVRPAPALRSLRPRAPPTPLPALSA